jgi:3-deoxy-D-manno-octulosonic acid kinase
MSEPAVPAGVRAITAGVTTAWLRAGYDGLFHRDETLLGPDGFSRAAAQDAGTGPRGGRGAAPTLTLPDHPGLRVVWRHYRRGGVLAPLLRDGFRDAWRPMRELLLSEALRARGVPTPLVIAALSHHGGGGWHTGDLITLEVPGAEDLGVFCRRTAALAPRVRTASRRGAARAVAETLATLHDAGGRHRDLNCANLLVANESGAWTAWVIDLDKSPALGPPLDDRTRAAQLLRLARSAAKLRADGVDLPWRDAWRVLHGYGRRVPGVRAHLRQGTGRGERFMHGIGWWLARAFRSSRRPR